MSATNDFFHKVSLLRSFCRSFNDSQLSDCLRQSSYNVELAAEKLLTGQYQPSTTTARNTATRNTSSRPTTTHSRGSVALVTPVHKQKKKKEQAPSASVAVNEQLAASESDIGPPDGYLLLCERWISDAYCTMPRGKIFYREPVALYADSSNKQLAHTVRVQARHFRGKLDRSVASFLAPLIDAGHVFVAGRALLTVPVTVTGGHVPLAVRVFVSEKSFFECGQQQQIAVVDQFRQRQPQQKKRTAPTLAQAVFELLQWAEHGNLPDFSKLKESNDSTSENKENDDSVDYKEEEDNDEEEDNEKTAFLTPSPDWASTLPEASDPEGMNVSLRPYQKQALHWMLQREVTESTANMKERLRFLSELTGTSTAAVPTSSCAPIACECGPVRVNEDTAEAQQPQHPMWKRRFLANPALTKVTVFYVNELLQVATLTPPPPPQPCSGGILADAMGLGKTVMLMSLVQQTKNLLTAKKEKLGPSLVVAKLSLLPQWEQELATKSSLTHAVYYGGKGDRTDWDTVDVVLTTYGTLQSDWKREQPVLQQPSWFRVILDEAHCIRNQRTIASKACCALNAKHRWCVSGTIIQNSLEDIFGILKFLRHEPWSLAPFWKAAISDFMVEDASEDGNEQHTTEFLRQEQNKMALDRIRKLLASIMLRRTKDSVSSSGERIIQLPPKETQIVSVTLSEPERDFYNAVLARSQAVFDDFVDTGTANTAYIQIFSMLQKLRQVCDHLALTVQTRFDRKHLVEDSKPAAAESKSRKAGNVSQEAGVEQTFLQHLMKKFYSGQNSPRKHKRSEPTLDDDLVTQAPSVQFLSQVADMVASLVKDHTATHLKDECSFCLSCPEIKNAVLTPCAHAFCSPCFLEYLDSKKVTKSSSPSSPFKLTALPEAVSCPVCCKRVRTSRVIRLTRVDDGPVESMFLTALPRTAASTSVIQSDFRETKEGNSNALAREILRAAVDGADSSKLQAIITELREVWKMDPGSKVLLYSHYLGFLDLLERRFQLEGIRFYRLDGSLSLKERVEVLKKFEEDVPMQTSGTVMLMSTSAGAEGLNLVSASSCFIADPWWNQAKEDQCINRIHRIGQTAKMVRVRKFVVEDSVEERIVELQACKKYVADEVYNESVIGQSGGAKLGLEEFKLIFRR